MIIYEKDNLGRSFVEIIIKNAGGAFSKPGVAYFLSHIFNTKGSIKSKEKFYSIIESNAIEFHTNVNKEFFTISIRFLNSKTKKALYLFEEILKSPNLTEQSFEKSKEEIKAKIKNKQNDNDYIANKNLFKTIFKDTPLMYPVIGENIENITFNDIQNFYNNLFDKEIVIINGGKKIDVENIANIFKNHNETTPFFTPKKSENIIFNKEVEQSYIHFAAPFDVDYNNELHLAKIATFILGAGGFGSRMMEEIRVKRGYAYSAYTTNNFKKTYKLLSGYLQTKLENQEDAIKVVNALINDFYENGITQEELTQAKQFLIGSEPLRNETLNQRLLKKFNLHYIGLEEDYYEKELKIIEKVTVDEVNSFIKAHPEIKEITYSIVTK